jgi:phage baseplate assembly protein W
MMARSSSYSFKSSGFRNRGPTKQEINEKPLLPIGFKTPLEKSDFDSNVFVMHNKVEDQIQDNLKNLLLTNKGERLGRFNFGASLRDLTFEIISSENFEGILMNRIKESVQTFMPYVELDNFTSQKIKINTESSPQSMTKVVIRVDYNVPNIGSTDKSLELILYVAG